MRNPYDDDEYDEEDYEDYDPEPDCWSQHFYLCKDRKGNVYCNDVVLAGYFGGAYGSFGYPDITIRDERFGLNRVRTNLRRALIKRAKLLQPGEHEDVTWLLNVVKEFRKAYKLPNHFQHVYRFPLRKPPVIPF